MINGVDTIILRLFRVLQAFPFCDNSAARQQLFHVYGFTRVFSNQFYLNLQTNVPLKR